jgi:TRAP-type C4-dicarboxylate transport system permease large subunit
MLAVIILWFLLLKRPIYEGIAISFILLVAITGTWSNIFIYIDDALSTSLLYSMVAFVAMSQILSKTKIIDKCVMIILSLFGRIRGGAGYASIIASSFMGSLSGSGPGNVMATGAMTIPAMKKSGFPAHLAANVESAASYLGNMIPPSSNIVAALGAFMAVYPHSGITSGTFWIVCWGCSLWFILSRIVQLYAFVKYYKIQPMAKEDVPKLKETLKSGWTGLLLPVVILFPFIFDSIFNSTFLTARLGATGAKYFSSSILIFIAGIATIYGILASPKRKEMTPNEMIRIFAKGVKGLAPTVGTCILGYMIGSLFTDIKAGEELQIFLSKMDIGLVGLAILIPLITCFITMVIPGSSVVVMFGSVFISLFAQAGANPLLVAAMLPCICGVMCGITPPFALGMYAGMSIAESDFAKTLKNDLWWVAVQYVMEVIVLLGWLPILGL